MKLIYFFVRKCLALFTHLFIVAKRCYVLLRDKVSNLYFFIVYGNKVFLFESHYEFDGNSGVLNKYLRTQKKYNRYTFVWIVREPFYKNIKNTKRNLVFATDQYSKLRNYLINHALFSFYDDIPIQAKGKNAKTIYLTHGQCLLKNAQGIIKVPEYVDKALCISDFLKDDFCSLYSCDPSKVFICGLPRNDVIFEKPQCPFYKKELYNKVVLWLPTFRKIDSAKRNDSTKDYPLGVSIIYSLNDLITLDCFLKNKNILLVLKFHPIQHFLKPKNVELTNIIFLNHSDLLSNHVSVNSLFPNSDALISDYSSAATDYLLTNKPIGYITEDMSNYKLAYSKCYYDSLTPGVKINNLDELCFFINSIANGDDSFRDKRIAFKKKIHTYPDGNNTKRLCELLGL